MGQMKEFDLDVKIAKSEIYWFIQEHRGMDLHGFFSYYFTNHDVHFWQ